MLPYKWVFATALIGMLVVAAGDTAFAALLQPIMDKGFVERDEDFIKWVPVLLLILAFVRGTGEFIDSYCMNWVARKVIHNLRQRMFEKLLRAPASYFDHHSVGSLVSRLTFDVEQVSKASSTAFRIMVRDALKATFLLCWMFYLSWKLSLIFIIIIPPAFLIFKVTSAKFRKISSRIQSSMGEITHAAKESLQGHRVVKIFGAYDHVSKLFGRANNHNRQQSMKRASILSASVPLTVFIAGAGIAGVIWLALREGISPGVFSSYLISMTMMMKPIKNLSKVNEVVQTGIAGAASIFDTLDMHSEKNTGNQAPERVKGDVVFNAVSFKYHNDDEDILHEVSFRIPSGSTVALVGESGSGKSTIASLLLRFYNPTDGSILLDGHNLSDISLEALRANTAIVTQDIVLFDDTIRNNIAYGMSDEIDDDRLMAAAAAAHVTEFVENFKTGFDTVVGEQGVRLSGGQRQRIAIARALYKDAPILILDEATSSLDSQSERHIKEAIDRLIENRTTLVIAHRLTTIENADLILVIDKGEIVERGQHQQLLDDQEHYYQLYSSHLTDQSVTESSEIDHQQ